MEYSDVGRRLPDPWGHAVRRLTDQSTKPHITRFQAEYPVKSRTGRVQDLAR
jgi:hypothetical protein